MEVRTKYFNCKVSVNKVTISTKVLDKAVEFIKEHDRYTTCYELEECPQWTENLDLHQCGILIALVEQYFYNDIACRKTSEGWIEWDFSDEIERINKQLKMFTYITSYICNIDDVKDNAYDFMKLQGVFGYLKRNKNQVMSDLLIKELVKLPKGTNRFESFNEIVDFYNDYIFYTKSGKEYIIALNNDCEISLYARNV